MKSSRSSLVAVGVLVLPLPTALAQPAPAGPSVALRSVSAVPSQATPLVRGVVAGAMGRFRACADTAWRTDPTIAGTVSVALSTGANGEVASARAGRSNLPPAAAPLAQCVVSAARRLMFPGSVQGTLDVRFTLEFTPGGAPAPAPTPTPAPTPPSS